MIEHAFDGSAPSYDSVFTNTRLGRWMREAVWHELAREFVPDAHILELGCGTGEDALWLTRRGHRLTATDASQGMLDVTGAKLRAAGQLAQIELAQVDMNRPDTLAATWGNAAFSGVLSNFGAVNCVADRRALAQALRRVVRPGGRVVLVMMSPICPWEIVWHVARGKPKEALRRFRSGVHVNVGDDVSLPVWYPSPARLAREFAPHFRHMRTVGIGALLPPPYLEPLVSRWPALFETLARLEPRAATIFPWTWLNDHYLMVLERQPK
jgi:ubiquinone/menaquinone biosynthesis C-methylase UbiE